MLESWCKSGRVPIVAGDYVMKGDVVTVKISRSGRFYAVMNGKYVPGLIYRLRAELDAQSEE
jgi:hypothetical protein